MAKDYPAVTGPSKTEMKKFQAEQDLRTLIEAEKMKKDKDRYAAAMKAHKEQAAALENVAKDKKD